MKKFYKNHCSNTEYDKIIKEPTITKSTTTIIQCIIKGIEITEEATILYIFEEIGVRTIRAKIEESLIRSNLICIGNSVKIELIENTIRKKGSGEILSRDYQVISISLV